jgi:uncharacterized membrane protein YcfT
MTFFTRNFDKKIAILDVSKKNHLAILVKSFLTQSTWLVVFFISQVVGYLICQIEHQKISAIIVFRSIF